VALLDRHIWRQVFWPSLVALLALNLLFLLLQLLRIGAEALGMGIGFAELAEMSVLMLPALAVFTVPVSALIGVMLAFGRLAQEGELAAWLSAGAGPRRLLRAPLALGLGAAVLTAIFSLWLGPLSGERLRRQAISVARRNIAASMRQGRFFEEIPQLVLLPGRPDGNGGWLGLMVYDRRQAPRHTLLLAEGARLNEAHEDDQLRLELTRGQLHLIDWRRQDYTLAYFERGTFRLELGQLLEQRTRFLSATDHLGWSELRRLADDPASTPRLRLLAEVTRQRRLVFPVSAPLFCWLGVLLTLSRLRAGRWPNLWLAVGLVAGYYLLMRFSDTLAEKMAAWAGLAPWLPAVALLAAAAWLRPRAGAPR
jgi:lipopolysaccharide export system permease protein